MKNQEIIHKAVRYTDTILDYVKCVDYEGFKSNSMMVEACVFNLSQMGELVNKLDDEYTKKHSEIPWAKIRGLRNRIIHDYEGVNLKLIWEIVDTDLKLLKEQLSLLIN
ncbi:MAG TPA: DUF86 domain-containing protein [Bacillota bacterium]|jgi:uncharacterized protein with HEPN domain|nr:DUF86 domain-containing protein [Bacillota bacterium]